MLYPPGFYYVKKPKRFVILSSDKSSECNLSCFFDIIKPRKIENLQSEEPFSSDPYFSTEISTAVLCCKYFGRLKMLLQMCTRGQSRTTRIKTVYRPSFLRDSDLQQVNEKLVNVFQKMKASILS